MRLRAFMRQCNHKGQGRRAGLTATTVTTHYVAAAQGFLRTLTRKGQERQGGLTGTTATTHLMAAVQEQFLRTLTRKCQERRGGSTATTATIHSMAAGHGTVHPKLDPKSPGAPGRLERRPPETQHTEAGCRNAARG